MNYLIFAWTWRNFTNYAWRVKSPNIFTWMHFAKWYRGPSVQLENWLVHPYREFWGVSPGGVYTATEFHLPKIIVFAGLRSYLYSWMEFSFVWKKHESRDVAVTSLSYISSVPREREVNFRLHLSSSGYWDFETHSRSFSRSVKKCFCNRAIWQWFLSSIFVPQSLFLALPTSRQTSYLSWQMTKMSFLEEW